MDVSRRRGFPAACGQPAPITATKAYSALLGSLVMRAEHRADGLCPLCGWSGAPVLPSRVFLVKCSEPNGDDSLFLISPYPPPTPNRFHIDLLLTVGVGILLQLLLPIINMIQDFFKRLGNISETTTAPLTEEMPTVFPSGFVSGGAQTGQSLGPGTLCPGCSPRVWGWGESCPSALLSHESWRGGANGP